MFWGGGGGGGGGEIGTDDETSHFPDLRGWSKAKQKHITDKITIVGICALDAGNLKDSRIKSHKSC